LFIDSSLWLDKPLEAAICSDSIEKFERHLRQGSRLIRPKTGG
jgi:hypothetical protein